MEEVTNKTHNDLATLEEQIQSNDHQQLTEYLKNLLPVELVRELYTLAKEDQIRLLELLGPEKSAELFAKISGLGFRAAFDNDYRYVRLLFCSKFCLGDVTSISMIEVLNTYYTGHAWLRMCITNCNTKILLIVDSG